MSVYIKGMEMPENCDNCDFMTVEGEYGEPTCPFGLIIRCASEMHPHCPLVPVPEHGRTIDADEYKQEMKDCRMAFWDEVLDSMPTIIPADKEAEG